MNEPVVDEREMSLLLTRAADAVPVDVASLVAGGVARGRAARRRRRVAVGAGIAGGVGVVAAVAVGGALVLGGGAMPVAVQPATSGPVVSTPAPQPTLATSGGPLAIAPGRMPTAQKIAPSTLGQDPAVYQDAPDAALALHDDAIHAKLAALLPAGTVGPILADDTYPRVDQGKHRTLHFTYDGALVSFIIDPAKGSETCESLAANAAATAGYGPCQQVGDAQVLTESQGGSMPLHTAMVWRHGYEISILSYNAGPADAPNPALDGKRLKTVSAAPPLDVSTLVAAASSDAWFK